MPNISRRPQHHGFTLLEVMVALVIFALLSTASYRFLQSMTTSRAATVASAERRTELEIALLILEQDMRYLIPRSVRVSDSSVPLPALTNRGADQLEFSRTGLALPHSVIQQGPGRVVYRLEDATGGSGLYRLVYQALDRVESSVVYRQQLLSGATSLVTRFQDEKGVWRSQWPPLGDDEHPADPTSLPLAVEIVLQYGDGSLQRVISLR